MARPISLDEFSTLLADPSPDTPQAMIEHPRFIQVRCRLDGTHPDVQVGQVWEDLDSRRGKDGARHVMVRALNDDGTVEVINVFVGEGSTRNIGVVSTIAIHRFRSAGSGRGFRLRTLVVHLTDTGRPRQGYSMPKQTNLTDFVTPDSVTTAPAPVTAKPTVPAKASTTETKASGTSAAPVTTPAASTPASTSKEVAVVSTEANKVQFTAPTQGAATVKSGDAAVSSGVVNPRAERYREITDILSGSNGAETLPVHRKMATRILSFMPEGDAVTFVREYVCGVDDRAYTDTPEFISEFVGGARRWWDSRKKQSKTSAAVSAS